MNDREIYQLADEILSAITRDLGDGIYAKLGGSLSLTWSVEQQFNAWAESTPPHSDPPNHKIALTYETARILYRDAEAFCAFATGALNDKKYQAVLSFYDAYGPLPECFSFETCVRTMFTASLTWVFFHELGHLSQEHGAIRSMFFTTKADYGAIQECHFERDVELKGKDAAVSHATEMAADFEAMSSCILELMRHFTHEDIVGENFDGTEFIAASYLLACGVSCIFYRFSSDRSVEFPTAPTKYHPVPIYRLEATIPPLYETLDMAVVREITKHNLDRRALVHLYGRAATSSAFFAIAVHNIDVEDFSDILIQGVINRSNMLIYAKLIIETWDEIEPSIQMLRRFGHKHGLLQFSDELRRLAYEEWARSVTNEQTAEI